MNYQAIIDKYEDRTDSGELKVNRSSLAMQYPDYARALEWMHNNARKEVASTGDVVDWYLNEEWRLDEAAKEGKTKEERFEVLSDICKYQLDVLNNAEKIKLLNEKGSDENE